MKKSILITIILGVAIIVSYFIYAVILSMGSQKMPIVSMSNQLKKLEDEILNETKGGSVYFYPIPKHKLKQCNAILVIDLSIRNDSITKSKKVLDHYILSIYKRVNQQLIHKECIDSLIIDVSSYYSKQKVDSLKQNKHRYSFPLKK